MPIKTALPLGIGGTVSLTVAEAGTITPATVIVYDEAGEVAQESANATISGSTLSVAVTSGTADALGDNYRADFTYTIGSQTYRDGVTFEVRQRVIKPRLSLAALLAKYPLLGTTAKPRGFSSSAIEAIVSDAWMLLANDLESRGKCIHLFRDYRVLEPAHAALAASRVALNFGPGTDTTTDWQAWAADREAEYASHLDRALAAPEWYDADEDDRPGDSERRPQGARGIVI